MTEPRPRSLHELDRAEALRLLAGVPIGRVVFTQRAMPAIRPVNHVVDDGDVFIRTHAGAAVLTAVGQVVAYEADLVTAENRLGWSVIVTGKAKLEHDPATVARVEQLIRPWVDQDRDHFIRIHPEFVTGYTLAPGD